MPQPDRLTDLQALLLKEYYVEIGQQAVKQKQDRHVEANQTREPG
jgi:hypothetical protein